MKFKSPTWALNYLVRNQRSSGQNAMLNKAVNILSEMIRNEGKKDDNDERDNIIADQATALRDAEERIAQLEEALEAREAELEAARAEAKPKPARKRKPRAKPAPKAEEDSAE